MQSPWSCTGEQEVEGTFWIDTEPNELKRRRSSKTPDTASSAGLEQRD